MIPHVRQVLDHCGIAGLKRLVTHKLSRASCFPSELVGSSRKRGNLEYHQVHPLMPYTP